MREEIKDLYPHLDWSGEKVNAREGWSQDTLTKYLQNRHTYKMARMQDRANIEK